MRTVYGDHERFVETYFTTYPGKYFTGDGCRRDEDGYYWITGRVDDVHQRLRPPPRHRRGRERAGRAPERVAEAAVVGYPHDIKGQGIYAYVTLKAGDEPEPTSSQGARRSGCARRSARSPRPTCIQFAPGLPKTRSGKIMRRILRKIAENDYGALGDTSTLADPAVVDDLVKNRQNR